ncbi:MAG: hypothetical protein KKA07_05130 [Bacteroidetes bacterium]|nr:hypothetical protein [Bacteroidota bacterium]
MTERKRLSTGLTNTMKVFVPILFLFAISGYIAVVINFENFVDFSIIIFHLSFGIGFIVLSVCGIMRTWRNKEVFLLKDHIVISDFRNKIKVSLLDIVRTKTTIWGEVIIFISNNTILGRKIFFMPRMSTKLMNLSLFNEEKNLLDESIRKAHIDLYNKDKTHSMSEY